MKYLFITSFWALWPALSNLTNPSEGQLHPPSYSISFVQRQSLSPQSALAHVLIARREALAHRLQVDILIVRVGDCKHLLNTEVDRVPRDLLHSVCERKEANR
jgi:hypothetical protein